MNNNRSNWDSHWGEKSRRRYWQEPADEIIRLRDSLDRQKMQDVLDLGCGIGRHAILFAEAGFVVTAVDDSQQALNILRKEASERQVTITCIKSSYTKDIFTENSFDIVIAYNVFYHGYRDKHQNQLIPRMTQPFHLRNLVSQHCHPPRTSQRLLQLYPCVPISSRRYGMSQDVT